MVDGLFEGADGLLIAQQPLDAAQPRRLRGRGVPFAMLDDASLASVKDGDLVYVDAHARWVVS